MIPKLTLSQKISRIKLAIKIMEYSEKKGVTVAKASKHYGKNRRFVYDVLRRWVKKNGTDVPKELIKVIKTNLKPKKINKIV
jgi:transposase